ncbi:Type IV leader peptidase family protein [Caldanaerobius fijiensis DSM 17918]|uniref:Type IV leader peptidase family protein n=1 Tax=Caldanaerobius fijiensis DSM 17918 TaxID=1121256 RepID=A0A1M5F996_9THEO|nr:A24 family peptidase [Caldanaerobius fijiensis]SHF87631.1 Type IV leader peptidase family protein [Caldanaerobius fijiensis DSM 17918]
MLYELPIILLVLYAAYTDIKRMEVDDWVPAAILVYSAFVRAFQPPLLVQGFIYMFLTFFILSVVYWASKGEGFGGGDIKLLSSMALFYNVSIFPVIFISCFINLMYGTYKGWKYKTGLKTRTKFAPFIFIATLLAHI